ncbi:hypothetical protein A3B36_02065 [Candidatus Uhrbacteria bacterium RIFCSPLOWO2_01_FULL_55_36]|uniref:Uncharacterized protein n=1 Tax=Candidatus Uhrbacteria bacterium RIFCSPLOWO2_01_FULL_55_36 TaxID=1802404 RepID=A0A1F7V1X7_9BACT|nr:MAG: hypothetical protein A3B36_02065 [Candidatus Uhrbacteria bacterium RIFCSPLOWO2_01_FULL_55_36]
MQVKSEELGEDEDLVMTGAGGAGNRFRFYVIVSAEGNKRFSEEQEQRVKAAFKTVGDALESKVESIEFGPFRALISVLIPLDVAPAVFIEKGIRACNKDGNFLQFYYYVTNARKPTKKDITDYLDGLENV